MSKAKLHLTILMALVMIISFACTAFAKDNVKIIDGNKAHKGKKAPRFIITTMNNEEFKLYDYLGKKAIIMSFWATYCEPCLEELPYLQKFYEKHSDCVEIIAITIDPKRQRKLIENNVKEMGLKFTIAHDYKNKLRKKIYQSKHIPLMIVINKEGKIVLIQNGTGHPDKLIAELDELLGDDLNCKPDEPAEDEDESEDDD
ncbi:redoxin domain-containing protein [bacterium]|nr:redoxin domain-containing protein [bacterium]